MPFVYRTGSALLDLGGFRCSDTPNTELDQVSMRPGARNVSITAVVAGGRGDSLIALSGIAFRMKRWTITPTGSGTLIALSPVDPGSQTCKSVVGADSSRFGLALNGAGGPIYLGGFSAGAAAPGGWKARNPSMAMWLEGSASQSIDMYNSSPVASLRYDWLWEVQE